MPPKPFVVAVSGISDILGAALIEALKTGLNGVEDRAVEVIEIVQRQAGSRQRGNVVVIDPEWTHCELDLLECCDVVIHVLGETLPNESFHLVTTTTTTDSFAMPSSGASWTDDKKEEAINRQSEFTNLLIQSIHRLKIPPKTFIFGSEAAYYGVTDPDKITTEEDEVGWTHIAKVCSRREQAASTLESICRVIYLRCGLLLSGKVGFLSRVIELYHQGRYGLLGRGTQWQSFVCLKDAVRAILFLLNNANGQDLKGPVNLTAPESVTNMTMFATLMKLMTSNDSKLASLKDADLRKVLGELPDEALLGTLRVTPEKLLKAGFVFQCPDITSALRYCLDEFNEMHHPFFAASSNEYPRGPAPSLITPNRDASATKSNETIPDTT